MPRSPYAVAKATAHWQVVNYREAYNLFACSGILFDHDSPLRPKRFVTKIIIESACNIANGKNAKLVLRNVAIKCEWGWAPEFVEAMCLILQQEHPSDFVIATGKNLSLEEFVQKAFAYFNLDYKDFTNYDNQPFRPSEISESLGDPSKAKRILKWKAKYHVDDVINMMIEHQLKENQN